MEHEHKLQMSYWDYRVICSEVPSFDGLTDLYYAIHEVYYDKEGVVVAWSANPVTVGADSEIELVDEITMLQEATTKAILLKRDLPGGNDEDI